MSKKVLFVATVVKMHINVFHLPFLKLFKENGWETHVAAHNDFSKNEICEIPYCDKFYNFPFERNPLHIKNFKTYKKLKKIIDDNEYQIIHCHTPVGGFLARLAAKKTRKKGTKVIYTAHGFHFYKGCSFVKWLIYYPIERIMANFTDVLITINNEDYILAQKFSTKTILIPGVGIDIKKSKKDPIVRTVKRKELNIAKNDFVLLSIGELSKRKNHQIVIRALATIEKKENIKYLICGQGKLELKLKKLVKKLKLENTVFFLGFRNDVQEIYPVADAFIFPSKQEGLPVALLEAMMHGLPVVCSNIRGNKDLIKDRVGGYVVENSLYDYQKAIIKLIEEENNFGENNKKNSLQYNINNILLSMKKIYFEK